MGVVWILGSFIEIGLFEGKRLRMSEAGIVVKWFFGGELTLAIDLALEVVAGYVRLRFLDVD